MEINIFNHLLTLFVLVYATVYGAFVAGLKREEYIILGLKWEEWIPESVFLDPGAQAQFIHRLLALLILILTFYIFAKVKKMDSLNYNKTHCIFYLLLLGQFILGYSYYGCAYFPCTSTSSFGILLALSLVLVCLCLKNLKQEGGQ